VHPLQRSRAGSDLHLHTYWSYDATARAERYFEAARAFGVRVIAIADHHVMDSLGDVLDAAARYPDVRAVPAAELTVHTSIGAVDLLCYGLPTDCPEPLQRVLEAYHDWQRAYGAAVGRGVRALGCDYSDAQRLALLHSYRPADAIDLQGVTHVQNGAQRRYFIERGFIARGEDYGPFMRRVAEAEPLPRYPAVNAVVPVVHDVGAVVAIAHPTGYFNGADRTRMDALREECRLDGIECAHQSVPAEFTPVYRAYCEANGLFSVAGSDCHNEPDIPDRFAVHIGEAHWLDEFLDALGPH